ncbi:MAG: FAD-dependent oxidoreductase [Anaerolineales bacterium]|nr:FAD-dependent oxidoreductase [Anaerolineales bacterium]
MIITGNQVNRAALIIGGGSGAIQAALNLADAGVEVYLVVAAPFLGANQTKDVPQHLMNVRQLEAIKHPRINLWSNTQVVRVTTRDSGSQGASYHTVELYQSPRYVDLDKCTACGDCIAVCPIEVPGTNRHAIYIDGQPGCAAIDKLGIAPCRDACPTGQRAQGYIALLHQKRYADAYWAIRREHPFPSVCGRVCNHRCEDACTRGRYDEPVNIMGLKRFVADWAYQHRQELPNMRDKSLVGTPFEHHHPPSGKNVAVIGAGPAGLTTALDLVRLGHKVCVFDALPAAGGMMRVGIPPHRLPEELLDWEIQQIIDEGVELKLNARVDNIPDLLKNGYDAVLIATGAHRARKLPIKNADHPDNWLSLDILRQVGLREQVDLEGRKVVVLGGGNVALDTARTVLRLGASEVRMACLEPRGEMPSFAWEIGVAEDEGVQILPGRTFKEILVQDDKITGVRCVEVVFRGFKDGRPDMDEISGSEHILPADLVIWAIGQAPELSFLPKDDSLGFHRSVEIQGDDDMMTTLSGVFVAGDLRRGVTFFVVDAINDGHKAARCIDRYLRGAAGVKEPISRPVVKLSDEDIQAKLSSGEVSRQGRIQISSIPLEQRTHNFREVDLTLTEEEALAEAGRCLRCAICSECLECLAACERGAIDHDMLGKSLELEVGVIIYAGEPEAYRQQFPQHTIQRAEKQGIYRLPPENTLLGSARAGQALLRLQPETCTSPIRSIPAASRTERVGLFLCQCGGDIAEIINLDEIRSLVSTDPGVVHTEIVPFMCSPAAVQIIEQAIKVSGLTRAVIAACSCCADDQVCFSCTYQRVRCKDHLGIFSETQLQAELDFVNIREQCAWVHADNPTAATAKTLDLVRARIARRRPPTVLIEAPPVEQSTIILGNGDAAATCSQMFSELGIAVSHLTALPERVWRADGQYCASQGAIIRHAAALVLAPSNKDEDEGLLAALGVQMLQLDTSWGGVSTRLPGVFYCDSQQEPAACGAAIVARVLAWLRATGRRTGYTAAVVDPDRCRACGDCVAICEYGAANLVGEGPQRAAWIDPVICTGCNSCAAVCPSGAITPASMTDAQLDAMLNAYFNPEADSLAEPKILVLTCNWNAYSGLETAGRQRLNYSASVRPVKVNCLGQLSPGMVIKAFEKGAKGILLLGCPPGECHYGNGNLHAEQVFAEARSLAALLGYKEEQLQLDWLAADQGEAFAARVRRFIAGLDGVRA